MKVPVVRSAALGFAVAGVLFLLYPVVRPYSDETTLRGAEAMGSSAWIAAHLFGIAGFVLLPLTVFALRGALGSASDRPASRALVAGLLTTWVGAGLVLPYYGAEDFALHAVARRALREHDAGVLQLADATRYLPAALVTFALGLVLLAVGAVLVAAAVWRSGVLYRWSGVPYAAGLVLYLPQFFLSPAARVAHGVLMAVGCLWLAVGTWRLRHPSTEPARVAA